jgi:hypothetical protein
MLGHGRFTFETPNVIDPGDMPPSRPSRLQKDLTKSDEISVGSNSNSNRSSNRSRHSNNKDDENDPRTRLYKPPLSRTIKIDYRLDADDEPEITPVQDDGEDDPEYGMSRKGASPPLSPSHEQARLFAATILSESERRKSSKSYLLGDPSKIAGTKNDAGPSSKFRQHRRGTFASGRWFGRGPELDQIPARTPERSLS